MKNIWHKYIGDKKKFKPKSVFLQRRINLKTWQHVAVFKLLPEWSLATRQPGISLVNEPCNWDSSHWLRLMTNKVKVQPCNYSSWSHLCWWKDLY